MQELSDRVAVVTGAASGIGLGLARRFAEEGMKLVLADIEGEPLERARAELAGAAREVIAVRVDVSQADEVEALCDQAYERFAAVHVLCNNAGVGGSGQSPLWKQSVREWEWVLGVNLWGVIHGIRAFVPRMLEQDTPGHIVNTASVAGLVEGGGVYGMTKHAVVSLSESLSRQLSAAKSKLGVSVLCPGFVDTRIWDSPRNRPAQLASERASERALARAAAQREQLRATLATGYSPAEIAASVVDGIRAERFYIVPAQPAIKELIQRRAERLISEACSPAADPSD